MHTYHLTDVFTNRPFGGNPLAVFTDAASILPELMPLIARELNLSETTFVLPPTNPANNYRVRIFTPDREMPMAGHPTIGTAHVLSLLGMIPRQGNHTTAIFEELVGDIPVTISYRDNMPDMIWMTQPEPQFGPILPDPAPVLAALSLPPEAISPNYPIQVVSTGVPYLYVPITSLDYIRRISIDTNACRKLLDPLNTDGIFPFTTQVETPGSTVHSRMFFLGHGIFEDPATGSAGGPLAAYLHRYNITPDSSTTIISEQGLEMHRPSYLHIRLLMDGTTYKAVQVGGQCHYMGKGQLHI